MADPQPVLRCGHCNKPFEKEATLKRHGYYCRSKRNSGPSAPRARACATCTKRKIRCDNRRPSCSHCVSKGLQCQYPTPGVPGDSGSPSTRLDQGGLLELGGRGLSVPPLPETVPSNTHDEQDLSYGWQDVAEDSMYNFIEWDGGNGDATATSVPTSSSPQTDMMRLIRVAENDQNQNLQPWPANVWTQGTTLPFAKAFHSITSPSFTAIPPQPRLTVPLLFPRPRSEPAIERTARLVLHTLKSYPLMLMAISHLNTGSVNSRFTTLPPFIHPALLSSPLPSDLGVTETELEPLYNSVNLVHMVGSGLRGSRKLFWRNVRMECEAICTEYLTMSRWSLLAAMQAVCIYIIVRLDGDRAEEDGGGLDYLLLMSVTILSKHFAVVDAASPSDPSARWGDWVYHESKRRICTIFRIVDLLVFFDPVGLCEVYRRRPDLAIVPLPAKRRLWEAASASEWLSALRENGNGPILESREVAFALATTGDLVALEKGTFIDCSEPNGVGDGTSDAEVSLRPASGIAAGDGAVGYAGGSGMVVQAGGGSRAKGGNTAASWDEWCSAMDGFGGLVMLAAGLTV